MLGKSLPTMYPPATVFALARMIIVVTRRLTPSVAF
jgi:hypothetical protein